MPKADKGDFYSIAWLVIALVVDSSMHMSTCTCLAAAASISVASESAAIVA